MRHAQAGFVDDVAAVEDQIQIERPRSARIGPFTASLALDLQEVAQQFLRGRLGVANYGGIEEARLLLYTDRIGLIERRDSQFVEDFGQPGDSERKMGMAVAEIAAKRNGDGHGAGWTLGQRLAAIRSSAGR